MNLPNKLTILRVVLAPLFLLLLLWDFPFHYLAAGLTFGAAALTDLFDGRIARGRGLVTNFGKFLDPLADKMLTTAAFIGFLAQGHMDAWALMLILSREFMVTSVRLLAAKGGKVVAASMSGKLKRCCSLWRSCICLQHWSSARGAREFSRVSFCPTRCLRDCSFSAECSFGSPP